MIFLSEQQLLKRYNSLSRNLRDILDSSDIGNIVSRICEQQHLSLEKAEIVGQIAAEIILGLLHAEDLSKEIQLNISLDKRVADAIADEVSKKVFSPIKEDLAKNYFPLEEEFYPSSPEVVALIQESRKLMNEIEQEIAKKGENIIDLKTFQKQEEVKETEKPIETEKLEAPQPPTFIPPKSIEVQPQYIAGEAEAEPVGPVIIHKEIETKPILGKQRSLGGLFGFLKTQKEAEKIQEQKPITAEVEIPMVDKTMTMTMTMTPPPAPPKVEPPKIVHYSELKTPISKPIIDKKLEDKSSELGWQKIESKSKIFESEIEKAKAAGLILDHQKLSPKENEFSTGQVVSAEQLEIPEVPIEIEEASRQSFFSRIIQSFAGLFVTKKKIIKEVTVEPTTVKMPEVPMPPKPEKEFQFPIEIKMPEPPVVSKVEPPKKEPDLPKPPTAESKTDIFKTKELESPEVHEAREKPQPIVPQPEKLNAQDKDVIDLRTFERIKK